MATTPSRLSSQRSSSAARSAAGAASPRPWRLRVGWGVPAPGAVLPPDEVHVALTLTERPATAVAELAELLSDDERAQVGRFRFEADRHRYTVCRGMLRLWLAHYLKMEPEELRFTYGPNGKPSITPEVEGLHFNISHSGGLAAFAITRTGEVGIDLEQVHDLPGWEQISVLCFAPDERALLHAYPSTERQRQFFRLWTRHEAWLKAWGVGLASERTVPTADDAWAQPGANGHVETFEPAPGYIATVAVLAPSVAAAS